MKTKYQIYKVTLHSGEIYIGQHKGDVLTDGYIGSPSGQNECNSYSLEDIARIEVLDFASTKKDINNLETEYIDYYRNTFGISSRVIKEYKWLLKYFKLGVCLNISRGYSSTYYANKQKRRDYFDDKLIVQCDTNWNFVELFNCMDDVMCKTKIKSSSGIYQCFYGNKQSSYHSRWILIKKTEINELNSIILEKKKAYETRVRNNFTEKAIMLDVYTETGDYVGRFNSIKKAMQELNIYDNASIYRCINGIQKSAHGYIFKSPEGYKSKKQKRKKVNQYDKYHSYITTHNSILAAARSIPGASSVSIGECCRGRGLTAYGYIWEFAEEEQNGTNLQTDMYDRDLNYVKTFDSMMAVCDELGYGIRTAIVRCCRGEQILCRNYTFRYHDPILAKKYEKQCNEAYERFSRRRSKAS